MKKTIIAMFLSLSVMTGVMAQENQKTFTPEEQAIVDISNNKWQWMAEKDVDKLEPLFHESAQFVHMGGYWGKQEELNTIRSGGIWYKKAEIHNVEVKFAAGIATVYSDIHLNSEVGGHAVRFPFYVTEVYVMQDGKWQLSSLVFTVRPSEQPQQ